MFRLRYVTAPPVIDLRPYSQNATCIMTMIMPHILRVSLCTSVAGGRGRGGVYTMLSSLYARRSPVRFIADKAFYGFREHRGEKVRAVPSSVWTLQIDWANWIADCFERDDETEFYTTLSGHAILLIPRHPSFLCWLALISRPTDQVSPKYRVIRFNCRFPVMRPCEPARQKRAPFSLVAFDRGIPGRSIVTFNITNARDRKQQHRCKSGVNFSERNVKAIALRNTAEYCGTRGDKAARGFL